MWLSKSISNCALHIAIKLGSVGDKKKKSPKRRFEGERLPQILKELYFLFSFLGDHHQPGVASEKKKKGHYPISVKITS